MSEKIAELAALPLPYQRRVNLREATFESGIKMLRLVFREGKRITQIDLDAASARDLAASLNEWADRQTSQAG